jgi:tRNA (guanosine-2'-O-)-methyltransferase
VKELNLEEKVAEIAQKYNLPAELVKGVTPKRLFRMVEVLERRQKGLQFFMDYVYSHHNLSAIVRSGDAVNIEKLYYRHQTRTKLNSQVTMGAERWLFIEQVEEIEEFYRQKKGEGFQIVSTDLTSRSIDFREVDYTRPTLIVVGNEVDGVSPETRKWADINVIIPMYGMSQSLNVSVASAVLLYEAQRQRAEKGLYTRPLLSPEEIGATLSRWLEREVKG